MILSSFLATRRFVYIGMANKQTNNKLMGAMGRGGICNNLLDSVCAAKRYFATLLKWPMLVRHVFVKGSY